MKNIEIYDGNFTIQQVKSNPNKLFVLPDNSMKVGSNPFRDLPNVLFLRIKKGSSSKVAAYFLDSDFEDFNKILLEDILRIKINLIQDKIVLFSSSGYGILEKIHLHSKKIKDHLDFMLKSNFNFENSTGKKFVKIPSYLDIQNSSVINLENLEYNTLNPVQIVNATLSQKKVAFTIDSQIEINTLVKFVTKSSQDVIVCRVTNCYPCDYITPTQWAILEICDESKYRPSKYQFLVELICSVNPNGTFNLNNDIFSVQKKEQISSKKIDNTQPKKEEPKKEETDSVKKEETTMSQENQQKIYELLQQINSKLNQLIESHPKKINLSTKIKNFKKTFEQLIQEKGISGNIKEIEKDVFEVESIDKVYFLKFKKGLLKNSIKVILTKDK